MIQEHTKETILEAIRAERLNDARQELGKLDAFAVQSLIEQLPDAQAAVAFRLLDRKTMLEVFESLPPQSQAQLIRSMSNEEAGRLLLFVTLIGVPEEPEDELAALHATSAPPIVQVVR